MARKVWKRKKGADLNVKLSDVHHFKNKNVECYFRDLETHLIQFIQESDSVLVCVAWLTSQPVLKAIVERPSVIILRNESWLNKKGGVAKKSRDMYESKTTSKNTMLVSGQTIKENLLVCGCISHPQNMHHKFVVRLDTKGNPVSVWTGSFNPTTNGNESLENGIVIHNKQLAEAYTQEFLQVHKISKTLKFA